jgi:hypothetical protein
MRIVYRHGAAANTVYRTKVNTILISVSDVIISRPLMSGFNVSGLDYRHTGSEVFDRLDWWKDIGTVNVSNRIGRKGIARGRHLFSCFV